MPVSFLTRLSQGLRSNETSCGSNGQYFRRDVVKLTRGMAEIGSVRCVHKMHGGAMMQDNFSGTWFTVELLPVSFWA